MEALLTYIEARISLGREEVALLEELFVPVEAPPKTCVSEAGTVERYLYFLSQGIVKGYQNKDGKIVVEHLVEDSNFFTSVDSFTSETISFNSFETVTCSKLFRIAKPNFELLRSSSTKWNTFAENIITEHFTCKMERVRDFQTLTAKERYLKFIDRSPTLALHVSVDNIASYLGIEPPSLSRIRRQIAI